MSKGLPPSAANRERLGLGWLDMVPRSPPAEVAQGMLEYTTGAA